MLFPQSVLWTQQWYFTGALALMCCCSLVHSMLVVPRAAAVSVARGANTRFLLIDGLQQQAFKDSLGLKLEMAALRSHKDRYHTLREAIERDKARRTGLERRVLAAHDEKVVPTVSPIGSNGRFADGGGPLLASLNLISGSSVGSGEYFASVSIGTPPQKLFLIADTGSDLTWVKCGGSGKLLREGEPATNHSFDEGASSSFAPLSCLSSQCAAWFFPPTCDGLSGHCKFSYSYSDQSFITGSLGFESITLGESQPVNVVMGCGRQYTGPNFEKAGGVLGLGQGPLSLASQLTTQSGYPNKFSYCLADFFGSSAISGSLAFGETLLQESLKYTPLLPNPYAETYYYVRIQAVKVGGATLDIPMDVWEMDGHGNGGTIVDSGTTLAQFVEPAYVAIRDAFQRAIQETPIDGNSIAGLDLCYKSDGRSSSSLPAEFAIVLDGDLVLEFPRENYFTEAAPGITCLAMQPAPPSSFSVIGNLLQQNFHIEFDRHHNRLGVSPTDCSRLHS